MLQTRTGKRSPAATFRIAVDMANEGLIKLEEALERIKPEDIERLFYPVLEPVRRARNFRRENCRGNQCSSGRRCRQSRVHGSRSGRVGGEWRKSNPGAPRNQSRRRWRHVCRAGNPYGDRRKDQPCSRGGARLGKMLHRRRGKLDIDSERKRMSSNGTSCEKASGLRSTAATAQSIRADPACTPGAAEGLRNINEMGR